MAKKERAKHSDSLSAMVDAAQAVLKPAIRPPEYMSLPARAEPFWAAIILGRTRQEWESSESDLVLAVELAVCYSDLEDYRQQAEILDSRFTTNAAGTLVPHPLFKLLDDTNKRALTLVRVLQLQASQSSRLEDRAGKRDLEHQARKNAEAIEAAKEREELLLP